MDMHIEDCLVYCAIHSYNKPIPFTPLDCALQSPSAFHEEGEGAFLKKGGEPRVKYEVFC